MCAQRQSKVQEIQLKCTKARNDYLLNLAAANACMNKYYLQDLSTLIDVSSLYSVYIIRFQYWAGLTQPLTACPLSAVIWVTTSPYPRCFIFTWPAANGPSRTWALGCSSWTQLCQNWTRTRTETLSCRPTSLPFACPSAFSTNPTKATRCFLIKCVCISGEMCGCLCMYPFPGGWGVGKVWDDGWAGDSLPAAAVQAVFSHHGCWGGTQTPKHHMQHYY